MQQAETLRKSILKKAFEGKLIAMHETAAPKGRDTETMGAAHREENIPPDKALKGRNNPNLKK